MAQGGKPVSATDLAKLAVCEKQLVFDKQRGRRLNKAQKEALALGREEHAEHHQQVQYYQQLQDKRCFIASAVFGPDDWRTQYLRDFRDDVLQRSAAGRCLICGYYRWSPALLRRLRQWPVARRPLQRLVAAIIRLLQRFY